MVTYYDGIYSDLTNVSQMAYYRIISFRNLTSTDGHLIISCMFLPVCIHDPAGIYFIIYRNNEQCRGFSKFVPMLVLVNQLAIIGETLTGERTETHANDMTSNYDIENLRIIS